MLNTDEEPAHEIPVKNDAPEQENPVSLEDLEDLDSPIEMAVHVEPGIQAPRQEIVADQTTQILSFYDEEPTSKRARALAILGTRLVMWLLDLQLQRLLRT